MPRFTGLVRLGRACGCGEERGNGQWAMGNGGTCIDASGKALALLPTAHCLLPTAHQRAGTRDARRRALWFGLVGCTRHPASPDRFFRISLTLGVLFVPSAAKHSQAASGPRQLRSPDPALSFTPALQ